MSFLAYIFSAYVSKCHFQKHENTRTYSPLKSPINQRTTNKLLPNNYITHAVQTLREDNQSQTKNSSWVNKHHLTNPIFLRNNHSTSKKLLRDPVIITKCYDENQITPMASLDDAQAYNKVWQETLFHKLKQLTNSPNLYHSLQ